VPSKGHDWHVTDEYEDDEPVSSWSCSRCGSHFTGLMAPGKLLRVSDNMMRVGTVPMSPAMAEIFLKAFPNGATCEQARGIREALHIEVVENFFEQEEEPYTQEDRARLLADLYGVGPEKPLGYLPLTTLKRCASVEHTHHELERKGLFVRVFDQRESNVAGGALYCADLTALQDLLYKNAHTLHRYEWPSQARAFINAVACVGIRQEKAPDLYRLIGLAFADGRFKT